MTAREQLQKTWELIRSERQADLEYYRQKVLLRSLHQRIEEGTTWYPVRLRSDYIGTGERLTIEVERTARLEAPHTFTSGKSVNVFCNASGKPEKQHVSGVINYIRDSVMVITLNSEELPDWMDDGQLGVDVMFDEMTYREMELALQKVIKAEDNRVADLREILLGSTMSAATHAQPLTGHQLPMASSVLNNSQLEALEKVVRASDVAFIHGPPGTGKTTTLTEAIRLTAKEEGQVLVCAPSNAAVDVLVEKLDEAGLNVLRIGHPARVTERSLSKTMDARIAQHVHYPELKSLRKRMEQLKGMAGKYKKRFGHHEREQRRLLYEEARLLKADADLLEFHIITELLNQTQAICCTLVGASHPTLRGRKYQTVFIDEAAQALEPACWIAMLRAQRVILAGDHQQLPPTIKSHEAAKQGLATTLFEKGIAKHPSMASMLRVQYRMHEKIMAFSSRQFYDGQLKAHESVAAWRLRPYHAPVEFIDTAGIGYAEKQDPETLSRYNEEEAQALIRHVEALVEELSMESWLEEKITMGIITPYRAQVDRLVALAEASPGLEPLHKLITINTVDAFQGQERDVIAISFVRSNEKSEVGFLADIRRTNVAMTRARKKLIMMGDSATLAAHPFYADLVDFVQQEGFYRSAFELPQ
ncbi:MAG: AAA domain-containing protein [Cyclobacteriaceae bacterium]|jgi:superfamily I DNA and/or RNA helicase|nr:AAA domain-containing protein [Cyclobacteriaceae bacterium]